MSEYQGYTPPGAESFKDSPDKTSGDAGMFDGSEFAAKFGTMSFEELKTGFEALQSTEARVAAAHDIAIKAAREKNPDTQVIDFFLQSLKKDGSSQVLDSAAKEVLFLCRTHSDTIPLTFMEDCLNLITDSSLKTEAESYVNVFKDKLNSRS